MESIAITDHGVLYGAIEFFIKAKEKGIKPIIGCEMYITPNDLHSKNPDSLDRKRNHLILLAKNEKGYKNLMKLISIAHLEGFYYKPRIDRKVLREHSEGLIGLSACAEGEVPAAAIAGDLEKAEKLALEYQEIFGEGNFYLELQRHPRFANQEIANQALIAISRKTGIPLVATNDVHYIHKDDTAIQDILICIQTNRKVSETDRMNLTEFELYLKSPEEMAESFARMFRKPLQNTQKIVEKCESGDKTWRRPSFPHFEVPAGFRRRKLSSSTFAKKDLEKRYGKDILPDPPGKNGI